MRDKILIVKPTHRCNLNCPYCYDLINRKHTNSVKDMDFKVIEQTLKMFGKNTIREWTWHGGEPLIVGMDWLDKATEMIKNFDDGIYVNIQTNGTLIDKKAIEYFKKYNIPVGISFDGLNNDNTRKNTKRLFEVFDLLKKENINFGCINVITKDNIDKIIDEYEYTKKIGINIQMNIVFKAKENDNSENIEATEIAENIIKFFDYWIYDKNNPVPSQLILSYLNLLLHTGVSFCSETDCVGKWFGIHQDGSIYPCGRDWKEEAYFGTVFDYENYKEIKNNEKFKTYRQETYEMLKKCSKCDFSYACNGGCYANAYNEHGNFKKPSSSICISNKIVFKHIFNRIKNIDIEKEYHKYNPIFIKYLQEIGYRSLDTIRGLSK